MNDLRVRGKEAASEINWRIERNDEAMLLPVACHVFCVSRFPTVTRASSRREQAVATDCFHSPSPSGARAQAPPPPAPPGWTSPGRQAVSALEAGVTSVTARNLPVSMQGD